MTSLRDQNRAEQRERILAAAWNLFSDVGFDEVTVADIAAAAGVARATVFNHFDSKQGLVEALTVQNLGFYRVMLEAALALEDTPTPVLVRALFDGMGMGIENTRRVQRGMFREMARLQLGFEEGGAAQSMNEENLARVVQLFERGQKRGDFRRDHDPEALAQAFSTLVNGTITDWLFNEREPSLRERMRAAAEIFLGPVAEDAAASRGDPPPDLVPERPGGTAT